MMKLYLNDFLNKKHKVKINDKVSEILELYKEKKFKLLGDINNGYYYLPDGFRFGFIGNEIDEIGLDLCYSNSKLIYLLNDKKTETQLNHKKIHEVLDFLNDVQIKWSPIESLDCNYLYVKLIDYKVVLIFDVYEGVLSKIVESNLG